MKPGSVSGYSHDKAIGHFYNRDDENKVGFEMRMTCGEYNELSKFMEKLFRDGIEYGRHEISAKVRSVINGSENPRG